MTSSASLRTLKLDRKTGYVNEPYTGDAAYEGGDFLEVANLKGMSHFVALLCSLPSWCVALHWSCYIVSTLFLLYFNGS